MAFEGMATPLGMKPGPSQRGVPPSWRWGLLAIFVASVLILALVSGVKFIRFSSEPSAVAVIERMGIDRLDDRAAICPRPRFPARSR